MEQLTKPKIQILASQIEIDLRVVGAFAARRAADAMIEAAGFQSEPIFADSLERLELARARLKVLRDQHPEWTDLWRATALLEEAAAAIVLKVRAGQ